MVYVNNTRDVCLHYFDFRVSDTSNVVTIEQFWTQESILVLDYLQRQQPEILNLDRVFDLLDVLEFRGNFDVDHENSAFRFTFSTMQAQALLQAALLSSPLPLNNIRGKQKMVGLLVIVKLHSDLMQILPHLF